MVIVSYRGLDRYHGVKNIGEFGAVLVSEKKDDRGTHEVGEMRWVTEWKVNLKGYSRERRWTAELRRDGLAELRRVRMSPENQGWPIHGWDRGHAQWKARARRTRLRAREGAC